MLQLPAGKGFLRGKINPKKKKSYSHGRMEGLSTDRGKKMEGLSTNRKLIRAANFTKNNIALGL